MTKKTNEYFSAQLNLIPCFYGIKTKQDHEKMDKNYKLVLTGLLKLNANQLEALNIVIDAIKTSTKEK